MTLHQNVRVSVAAIAASAVRAAIARGDVATCSGRSSDLWHHIASRFGPQAGSAIVQIHISPSGLYRVVTQDDSFDHVVCGEDARKWLHRAGLGAA